MYGLHFGFQPWGQDTSDRNPPIMLQTSPLICSFKTDFVLSESACSCVGKFLCAASVVHASTTRGQHRLNIFCAVCPFKEDKEAESSEVPVRCTQLQYHCTVSWGAETHEHTSLKGISSDSFINVSCWGSSPVVVFWSSWRVSAFFSMFGLNVCRHVWLLST